MYREVVGLFVIPTVEEVRGRERAHERTNARKQTHTDSLVGHQRRVGQGLGAQAGGQWGMSGQESQEAVGKRQNGHGRHGNAIGPSSSRQPVTK